MNSKFYDDIKVIRENFNKYIPYVNYDEKPLRDVAIYHNAMSWIEHKNGDFSTDTLKTYYMYDNLKKIDGILSGAHIDYEILNEKSLGDLSNYKVIILPSLTALNEDECDAVREYVKNGGSVYVSGITSLYDGKGTDKDNFALSDLLGVDYNGIFEIKPAYLAPTNEAPELFGDHTRKYPHMLEENIVRVTPNTDGNILATVTLPIGDVSDNICFSSAISDPPINYTEYPALFEHSYGKGNVIYSAGCIEYDKFPDNAKLFCAILKRLAGEFTTEVTAPTCVDFTAYASESRISVNLLNNQTVYPPIRIDAITVSVDLDNKKVKSVTDVSGGKLDYVVENGHIVLTTDLDFYKLIVIETE
jgi:hypothetical protein